MGNLMPSAGGFSVRQAKLEDLDRIFDVEQSAFPPNLQATKETLAKRMGLFGKGFIVLVADGKIVAFSTALLLDKADLYLMDKTDGEVHIPDGKIYYIRSLAVGKGAQSKGYGKMLIDAQLRNAKELNSRRVVFTCIREVAYYYAKLGFLRLTDFVPFHGNKEALWEVPPDRFSK